MTAENVTGNVVPGNTFVAMLLADMLQRWLGETGSDVVGRISGVLLAALAVQFVLDGLRQTPLFFPA